MLCCVVLCCVVLCCVMLCCQCCFEEIPRGIYVLKFKVLFHNLDERLELLIVSEFHRQFTVSKVVCDLRNLFLFYK